MSRHNVLLVTLLATLACVLCGCTAIERDVIIPNHQSFDLETDGLVLVQTVHEEDHEVKCFALAPGIRIMDADSFTADDMQVFMVSGFSTGMDNMQGPIHVYDENRREIPVTREISTICHAMRDVGHHVLECRIIKVGDEWFVSAMLNVNLWTPYQFYYLNKESGKLMLLYEFNGRDVITVRILSAERLHALNQRSIGGWYDPVTPDRLMTEHPEVIKDVAVMLLHRGDLFDEAAELNRNHERKIGWETNSSRLEYAYLLHNVMWGSERIVYLSDGEKEVFRKLIDQCFPYEIEEMPGDQETCTTLVFRFSVFNSDADRQEEWTLFRVDAAPDDPAYTTTISQLEDRYGPLTQCDLPCWLKTVHADP